MAADDLAAAGGAALEAGRWVEAREAFEASLAEDETARARFGLAAAQWWLGENREAVANCTRAYTLFRQEGDLTEAVECAVWLAVTYKANFANAVAADGWAARAERLLDAVEPEPGVLRGWVLLARAYRLADLTTAARLTEQACALARQSGDVDLELVALSQLGLIQVGQGATTEGFALIDEAMAAVLAREGRSFDTVAYTCCDMLNACELANDLERAAQWCKVADDFVDTYGSPFLYAECRIFYGSVLAATGRWADADQQLRTGLQITAGACPALHARAVTRLAGLRLRQGRIEEAEHLLAQLDEGVDSDAESALSVAAVRLARGDAEGASRTLQQRWSWLAEHRTNLAVALDLLVDAHLGAGELAAAATAAERLTSLVTNDHLDALAHAARGRVALATGETGAAIAELTSARQSWTGQGRPFELARTRFDLARALAVDQAEAGVDEGRRALALFELLGAVAEADRVAAFLRSLGVSGRTGPKGVGTLTVREQEVLDLLGFGLSNPEIAERLHVSRKTAAHHVSSILAKLNLRNRAEAAAFAVARTTS